MGGRDALGRQPAHALDSAGFRARLRRHLGLRRVPLQGNRLLGAGIRAHDHLERSRSGHRLAHQRRTDAGGERRLRKTADRGGCFCLRVVALPTPMRDGRASERMPEGDAMSAALSASIVTHAPDLALLDQTLDSLRRALHVARARGMLVRADVSVIDNGPGEGWRGPLRALLERTFAGTPWAAAEVVTGHGNVGYGRGHNLALLRSGADYHLVLNPDVMMQDDTVCEAIAFMQSHRDVDLLAPLVIGPDGKVQYLCKRYPALFDLALRGFAPQPVKSLFRSRLERYEMKCEADSGKPFDATLASGCCM